MIELWKPVVGYETAYEVSNLGSVKSLSRYVACRGGGQRLLQMRIMSLGTDSDGYKIISLYKDGRGRTQKVHRLVMYMFIQKSSSLVEHIDDDISNNSVENLRYRTASQISMKRRGVGMSTSKFKGVSWSKKLKKWKAGIRVNGNAIHLGYFREEKEAALAYDKAAKEFFGGFAKLNFSS